MDCAFMTLDVPKMCDKAEKISKRLSPSQFESRKFKKYGEKAVNLLSEEIKGLTSVTDILVELKSDAVKSRHWEMILKIIKRPQLINTQFKLQELTESGLAKYIPKIKNILDEAKEENRHESDLVRIRSVWESMQLEFEESRIGSNVNILVNTENLEYIIEEHIAIIDNIEHAMNADHIQAEIEDWKIKLHQMKHVITLWVSCQNAWLQLEPIFNSDHMQTTMPVESEAFVEMQTNFKRIMWAAEQTPKATFNLLVPGRDKLLESVLEGISNLKKNVKGFLDSRRFNFPRFFFLSDPQLLLFLSSVHAQQEYDKHLCLLFPGASKFFIKKLDMQELTPSEVMSLDLDYSENEVNIDENLKTEKSSYVLDSDVTDHKSEINHYLAAKNRLREKYNSSYDKPRFLPEILGFQGHNGEVLLFEKSISIVENIEE